MPQVVLLREIELIPVLEIESFEFKTQDRAYPSGSRAELGNAWLRYWLEALADSDITGLEPIYPGSQHVATTSLIGSRMLEKVLQVLLRDGGGVEGLADADAASVLNGGLALRGLNTKYVIQPTCCSDFRAVSEWREAVSCGGDWRMLWIGHPWVSIRYEAPHLILSRPHESPDPIPQWAVAPDELTQAVTLAEQELERFADSVAAALSAMGCTGDPEPIARRMAGLA